MKWLFYILLVANLGMFIWLFPQQEGNAARGLQPADVGQLRLVGEPAGGATGATQDGPPEIMPLPPVTDTVAADASEPGQPAESPQLPAVVEAEEPALVEEAPPPEPPESPSEPICASVGAFDKRSQAELLSVRLLAQGVKTEIASESTNEQAGFWVLIPPQRDRETAVEIAKQLEAAGVDDLWRFTSGKLAHAISLGLFRDEERAKARRDKITAMGFESEVQPRYREQTNYWLNYQYTGESPLTEDRWRELSEENPQLELNESPCR
jgi:cell division protein FtsN